MNQIKVHFPEILKENNIQPKPKEALRILHTSDWHLGKMLYTQSRYDEFSQFLDWLHDQILKYQVDILIVAGDIFDTMTPSNHAESIYHNFLAKVYKSGIKHIVITAGNHDSPTSLQKTKSVLGMLNIHVIGHIQDNPTKDVLVLKDNQTPLAIIIAVPFLRDRDVRHSQDAQNIEQRTQNLLDGIAKHYQELYKIAQSKQKQIQQTHQKIVPIIATGHLFVAGSSVSSSDDGMRDLQIGTLGQVSSKIFHEDIDYVALGHIHAAQKVANQNHIRYCGSPIAMGFGELGKVKQVLLIDFQNNSPVEVQSLFVPIFQHLARISGDLPFIEQQLLKLKSYKVPIWLEIEYLGKELIADLKQVILSQIKDSNLLALSIKNRQLYRGSIGLVDEDSPLESLNEIKAFQQRLNKESLSDTENKQLMDAYQELLYQMQQEK